ncbi:MAG: ABC transporter ATP-binding protein [Verrucomicrobia bacterium]|nr:ABC transporter ATP-binding protein [Verrucomicrobiota bacterium]
MSNSVVRIRNLSKHFEGYPKPALKGVDCEIQRGHIVGLVGPDGAGKTTLLRLIAGLLLPTTGTIEVDGFDTIKQAQKIHSIIGYMPQKFGLYEDLSVLQNLTLYADLRNVVGEERKKTFARLLKFTGLAPYQDRLARNLSGGMKQKLGLSCALVYTPTLLLLDEPSVGVDPISRRELWKMVFELVAVGITVIWSSSYLDETEKCHSVLLLNEGELLYDGSPQKFTGRVEGRVFKIANVGIQKRQVLAKILEQPEVVDGVVQGSDLRLVMKEKKKPAEEGNVSLTSPRFEDAFIDLLGGGPKGVSPLVKNGKPLVIPKEREFPIVAQELVKRFGDFTAVGGVSFKVKRGEVFGLLGPNGAGKSTTFRMMCGLLKPTSGEAFVEGFHLQRAPGQARAEIGYMAQKFSLYGNLSVDQNLNFFAGAYGLSWHERTSVIKRLIEMFNFEEYRQESADNLPLGFKQRLALSCSLMHRPHVLFLDEPTSGVDPLTRREFWNHINSLVQTGVTVIVTTHFMDEAEYCDRIGLVYRSKLIALGTPDELKAKVHPEKNLSPTIEDAFIQLIENYDAQNPL